MQVVCECGEACSDRFEVPVADYDRARRDPTHFVVLPEHHTPEVDRMVENHGSWLLVEAFGPAAKIARAAAAR